MRSSKICEQPVDEPARFVLCHSFQVNILIRHSRDRIEHKSIALQVILHGQLLQKLQLPGRRRTLLFHCVDQRLRLKDAAVLTAVFTRQDPI